LHVREPAVAEQGEEILELQPSKGGDLQLQQGILTRVYVHGIDPARTQQGIVQRVAAGRRDRHQAVARTQGQGDAVQSRVLPTGVVNQMAAVNQTEYAAAEPFLHGDHAKAS
jgi:hypothetical protein